METLGIVAIWIIFGLIGAFIAHTKNRNKILWFILSAVFLFIPPIVLLFLPKIAKGESPEDGALPEKAKSIPIGKIVTGIVIVVVAGLYAYNLQLKKEEAALEARRSLINSCNSDSDCLNKIESNFDRCIEANLKIEKTGRRSREIRLDGEHLKSCIGL